MKNKILALALVSSLALTACAQPGQDNPWGMGNKQTAGTVGGAVAGGVIGSKLGGGRASRCLCRQRNRQIA